MTTPGESSFEGRQDLPSDELRDRAKRLVGFGRRFDRIRGHMLLLTDTSGIQQWADHHHEGLGAIIAALRDRYPLLVFHGDVGTGKTVTAEAAADAVARLLDADGFLLKLSTRVRGVGHVGEMSTLIGDAFAEAIDLAGRKRFVALIIDEGDALAFNRGAERAHHEDRVGVNTLIQMIDQARQLRGRLLVVLCTNRFHALDPAILRRAALIEEFRRPDDQERRELFNMALKGVNLEPDLIDELITITGARDGRPGFTFSDIQTRLLPAAVIRAYPDRALAVDDLLIAAAELEPSPVMEDVTE